MRTESTLSESMERLERLPTWRIMVYMNQLLLRFKLSRLLLKWEFYLFLAFDAHWLSSLVGVSTATSWWYCLCKTTTRICWCSSKYGRRTRRRWSWYATWAIEISSNHFYFQVLNFAMWTELNYNNISRPSFIYYKLLSDSLVHLIPISDVIEETLVKNLESSSSW